VSEKPPPSAVSPARSALAVFAGVIVYWFLLSLFMGMSAALVPSLYPREEGQSQTTAGLVTILVGEVLNGMIAGLLASRIAGRAPMAHAAALAGLLGLYAMTTMDQVQGLPGWFAMGFACAGPVAVLAGAAIGARVSRATAS
jgi:hypothetical protein